MDFRMQDRMELKALVDFYATESDKNKKIVVPLHRET